MKFPLKYIRHDLGGSTRGQGRRSGGMIMGSMSARAGVVKEFDAAKTYGLPKDKADDVRGLNMWEFMKYQRMREDGIDHDEAILLSYDKE